MILAAYQGPSPKGDMVQAFKKINEILAQAAKQGAKMVVFPELYLLGYNQMHRHKELAQPIGGDWEIQCAKLAQKHQCGLTIGWAERDGKTFYNSASTFDSSGIKLGHYRKIQLWGPVEKSIFESFSGPPGRPKNDQKLIKSYIIENHQNCSIL